jgi:CRISPR-associated endonuclease/helicase Cas3
MPAPSNSTEPWRLFWAKTDRDGALGVGPAWTRPLWAHLLDVAHAALLLWEAFLPTALKQTVAGALGMSVEEAGRWLALQVGLHDLGKAIPSFQLGEPTKPHVQALRAQGLDLPNDHPDERAHHGHATIALLYRDLPDAAKRGTVPSFLEVLYAAVGFHHGRLIHRAEWKRLADSDTGRRTLGGEAWGPHQRQLLREVRAAWTSRYGPAEPAQTPSADAPWMLALAGWASTADWLGSMARAFPTDVPPSPVDYLDASQAGAADALHRAGFDLPARLGARPFDELFPSLSAYAPRPIQRALIDLPVEADAHVPTLTLVEAPTGEGKTEGALALAARQQAACGPGGGVYLALPTQATAAGLMPRVLAFLDQAHDGPAASFRLAYGRSELNEQAAALVSDPADLLDLSDDTGDGRARTLRWFLSARRALLAPYGLGTVDQALLGVLYARHFFVRLFGLAGKTVVVDEVHAYDVYTGRLVLALLPWLRALGCHVILLSATLPARLRSDLLNAWDPTAAPPAALPEPHRIGYPAIWRSAQERVDVWAGAGDGLTPGKTQHAALERGDPDPDAVARRVREAVEAGAVVAVVCNTVKRAQEVFTAVEDAASDLLPDAGDRVLLHARFVRRERQQIENHVVGYRDEEGEWVAGRMGKGRPSGPAVLVGTQIIEQSLDLDVDLMLTDLAPVDLVLQRAGRLHRHDRDDRPPGHEMPRLVWLCPTWEGGALPDVDAVSGGGKVYDRTILWRTALLLGGHDAWDLPGDYRPLIERVYGSDAVPEGLDDAARAEWSRRADEEQSAALASGRDAEGRLIPEPRRLLRLFVQGRYQLADEDDEAAAHAVKAATREGDSVEVVVLHRHPDESLHLDRHADSPAPLALPTPDRPLPTADVRALLGASVRLSRKGVIGHLRGLAEPEVPVWSALARATPSLRGLHPIVLESGVWCCPGTILRAVDRLGLVLESPSRP